MLDDHPHDKILDRREDGLVFREEFKDQLTALESIVNYGTYMIIRCTACASERTLAAILIGGALLSQAVASLDSIHILLSESAVRGAEVHLRTLFEIDLYMKWLLKADTQNRLEHFLIWYRRKDLYYALIAIEGTPEFVRFKAQAPWYTPSTECIENAEATIRKFDLFLQSNSRYPEINAKFDKAMKQAGYEKPWYALIGGENKKRYSIWAMAEETGFINHYQILFRKASGAVHGQNLGNFVSTDVGSITYHRIRDVFGVNAVFSFAYSYAVEIYKIVLDLTRPGEESTLAKKNAYWRKLLFSE